MKTAAGIKRADLFNLIEELVMWENSNNPDVIRTARAEIARCVASRLIETGALKKDASSFGPNDNGLRPREAGALSAHCHGARQESRTSSLLVRRVETAARRSRECVPGGACSAGARSVLRRRFDSARSPTAGAAGVCQRPQPGAGADQQGAHRDSAEVRRAAAGQPGVAQVRAQRPRQRKEARRSSRSNGRVRQGWPRTCGTTASGCGTKPRSGSGTCIPRSKSPPRWRKTAPTCSPTSDRNSPSSPGFGRGPSPCPNPACQRRYKSRSCARSGFDEETGKKACVRAHRDRDSNSIRFQVSAGSHRERK